MIAVLTSRIDEFTPNAKSFWVYEPLELQLTITFLTQYLSPVN